jgi:hypothetical protein
MLMVPLFEVPTAGVFIYCTSYETPRQGSGGASFLLQEIRKNSEEKNNTPATLICMGLILCIANL